MHNLLTILCIFPGPLLPFLLTFGVLRKRASLSKCLFMASVVSLTLFVLCIVVPYHFQGYSRLEHPTSGEPLGWTALPFVGTFAYLYTFKSLGFLWLFTGVVQAGLGEISPRRVINSIAKTVVLVAFAYLLFEFHQFNSTINAVLE